MGNLPGAHVYQGFGLVIFAFALVVFIVPVVIGVTVLRIGLRGKKVKAGTYSAPYPGQYPSADYKPSRFQRRK